MLGPQRDVVQHTRGLPHPISTAPRRSAFKIRLQGAVGGANVMKSCISVPGLKDRWSSFSSTPLESGLEIIVRFEAAEAHCTCRVAYRARPTNGVMASGATTGASSATYETADPQEANTYSSFG